MIRQLPAVHLTVPVEPKTIGIRHIHEHDVIGARLDGLGRALGFLHDIDAVAGLLEEILKLDVTDRRGGLRVRAPQDQHVTGVLGAMGAQVVHAATHDDKLVAAGEGHGADPREPREQDEGRDQTLHGKPSFGGGISLRPPR